MSSAESTPSREVHIFGTDSAGKPFFQTARAFGFKGIDVTLDGLSCTLKLNDTVGIRHAGQKARFRVLWVGAEGTPRQGQVVLRALELEKNIFGLEVPGKPAPLAASSFGGRERRQYPRIPCHGTVKFHCKGTIMPSAGKLQILSEGGCYIETLSTAPCFSHLDMVVNAEGLELQAEGVVRDSHAGCGMGVAFREINPAYLNRLQEWVFRHSSV